MTNYVSIDSVTAEFVMIILSDMIENSLHHVCVCEAIISIEIKCIMYLTCIFRKSQRHKIIVNLIKQTIKEYLDSLGINPI